MNTVKTSFTLIVVLSFGFSQAQYTGNKRKLFNSYVLVNDGLEQTKVNLYKENQRLYYQLTTTFQAKGDSIKTAWDSSQVVRSASSELIDYITNLKVLLIGKSEGKTKGEVYANDTIISLKNLSNFDDFFTPSSVLIGENRWNILEGPFSANELKGKLMGYKKLLQNQLKSDDKSSPKPGLPLEDFQSWTKSDSWEVGAFYNAPLAGVLTYLSKLQVDILLAENLMINHYLTEASR